MLFKSPEQICNNNTDCNSGNILQVLGGDPQTPIAGYDLFPRARDR